MLQEWAESGGSRVLSLPEDANPEAMRATMSDGVLVLDIEKYAEKQPRKVEIN